MKTKYQNYIISKLRNLRIDKGYTQIAVAKLLDISPGQLGNIESYKQKHKFTLRQIMQLCHTFQYPIEKLFMEESCSGFTIEDIISKIIEYEQNE